MKLSSYSDSWVRNIIACVPLKFKNVLMFEPPNNFENKELFDWGYNDFYLCISKSHELEPCDDIFQWIAGLNSYFTTETTIPPKNKYKTFFDLKATWFSKEFVLRNGKFEVDKAPSFGTRLKQIIDTYTEETFMQVVANRIMHPVDQPRTKWSNTNRDSAW